MNRIVVMAVLSVAGVVIAEAPVPQATATKNAVASAKDPTASNALGRVGNIWFTNDELVQQTELASFTNPESGVQVLPSRSPAGRVRLKDGVWSNVEGDYAATKTNDGLHVKGYDPAGTMLAALSGDFTVKRVGGDTVIDGSWGTDGVLSKKYPVHITYSADHVDMVWGFYERHMKSEPAPQLAENCRFYSRRDSGNAGRLTDAVELCGAVLANNPPAPQVVMAFLMAGFRRYGTGAANEHPAPAQFGSGGHSSGR